LTRFVDRGAVFAGWVGLGMALVIVMAFALIIPIQTIVFVMAPLAGVIIGAYANVRSERWRPRGKVLLNAAYAGVVTGVGIAVFYLVIRLVFLYGDSGFPIFNRTDPVTHQPIPPYCQSGPDCTYRRLIALEESEGGTPGVLASLGITDAKTMESALWHELIVTGAGLALLTIGGSLVGGATRSLRKLPTSAPLPTATSRAATPS
jgi:hypothetical protein